MKMKIKTGKKETNTTSARNAKMQYGGKLHRKYNNKKVNVDRIRDIINYANL